MENRFEELMNLLIEANGRSLEFTQRGDTVHIEMVTPDGKSGVSFRETDKNIIDYIAALAGIITVGKIPEEHVWKLPIDDTRTEQFKITVDGSPLLLRFSCTRNEEQIFAVVSRVLTND